MRNLRNECVNDHIVNLSMTKFECNENNLEWSEIRPMIRYLFKGTNVIVHVFMQGFEINNEFSEEEKLIILKEYHDNPLGGHQGVTRTYRRIRETYNWSGIKKDIKRYISKCVICQRDKLLKPNVRVPMEITDTPSYPFEKCSLDIVGPLTETTNRNKYILTFQDHLSKYSEAMPIPNQEAETVAKEFVTKIICKHGTPKTVLTDQGSNFLSDLFRNVCKLLHIKKVNTSAFRPQSNGALERSHLTLAEYLRHYVANDQSDWDEWLPYAMFVYNTTPHTSTKFTPFELVYGVKPKLPSSLQEEPEPQYTYDDYVQELKKRLQSSHLVARENLLANKVSSKDNYDRKSKEINYEVGDLVLLRDERVYRGRSKKLCSPWIGPYKILSKEGPVNYVIKQNRRNVKVHCNRIKHFVS